MHLKHKADALFPNQNNLQKQLWYC